MVSTVWSVSCLLFFFYSRCPPPCPMAPLYKPDIYNSPVQICWLRPCTLCLLRPLIALVCVLAAVHCVDLVSFFTWFVLCVYTTDCAPVAVYCVARRLLSFVVVNSCQHCCRCRAVRDNHIPKSHRYVCITNYQPDTKSNPNINPDHNHTAEQHAIANIRLIIVTCPHFVVGVAQ